MIKFILNREWDFPSFTSSIYNKPFDHNGLDPEEEEIQAVTPIEDHGKMQTELTANECIAITLLGIRSELRKIRIQGIPSYERM